MVGMLLLESGMASGSALRLEETLKKEPNRLALRGRGQGAEKAGDSAKPASYYNKSLPSRRCRQSRVRSAMRVRS